jgi:predicted O-methyltransferase YrrM
MTLLSSIYDLTLEPLCAWDFSRPLFVQASRSAQFDELVDVFHSRLELRPAESTILTSAAYRPRPGWAGQHLVNPDAQLSGATAASVSTLDGGPFSVVVATTRAHNMAMRFHSNVASFCHAMEPRPSIVVSDVGQFAAARDFFLISDHAVRGTTFVGNMLVSQAEAEALFDAAVSRPTGHVVEVGRFSGGTAVLLALAARASGRPGVVSIDVNRLPGADYFCRANGVDTEVQLLDGDSEALAAGWRDLQTDPGISLLFIDADHSFEGVVRDLSAWGPYIVDGGTIALHDTSTPDCGVAKAIYHHLAGHEGFTNFRQVGSTVICERRTNRSSAHGAPALQWRHTGRERRMDSERSGGG